MAELVFLALCIAGAFVLAMRRAPLWAWALALAAATYVWQSGLLHGEYGEPEFGLLGLLAWVPVVVLAGAVRARRSAAPALIRAASTTRSRASCPRSRPPSRRRSNAGTIGFDAELFSGQPDWDKLRAVPPITLTEEEKAFLDGPDQRAVPHGQRLGDPPQRARRSPTRSGTSSRSTASSACSSPRSTAASASRRRRSRWCWAASPRARPTCAPSSWCRTRSGPGELIEKYGTPEQKDHYLPRLAKGLEVPCFSLTGPTSGSDAATMRDVGYVTRGRHEGKEVVGIRALLGEALHHAGAAGDAGRPRLPPVRPREPAGPRRGHRHHRGAACPPTIPASRSAAAICRPAPPSRTARTGAATCSSRWTG